MNITKIKLVMRFFFFIVQFKLLSPCLDKSKPIFFLLQFPLHRHMKQKILQPPDTVA